MKKTNQDVRKILQVTSTARSKERPKPAGIAQIQRKIKQADVPVSLATAEILAEHKGLVKRMTAGKLDQHFDVFIRSSRNIPEAPQNAAFTYRFVEFRVPEKQIFTLQNYLFFVEVNDDPISNFHRLAEPNELLGIADFQIYVDGSPPLWNPYWNNAASGFPITAGQIDGFPALCNDLNRDSAPNHGGVTIVVKGGSMFGVEFRKYVGQPPRLIESYGCRLRGFFSPEFSEDQEER